MKGSPSGPAPIASSSATSPTLPFFAATYSGVAPVGFGLIGDVGSLPTPAHHRSLNDGHFDGLIFFTAPSEALQGQLLTK